MSNSNQYLPDAGNYRNSDHQMDGERWANAEDYASYRRERVGRLRLQGFTPVEITEQLASEGLWNTYYTRDPISVNMVTRDLMHLSNMWRDRAVHYVAEYKGKMLAELEAVMARGWAENRMSIVLDAIKQIRALLGLDAPIKIDMSPEDLDKQIEASLADLAKRSGHRIIETEQVGDLLKAVPTSVSPDPELLPAVVPNAW